MFGVGNGDEKATAGFRDRHQDGFDLFARLQRQPKHVDVLRQLARLHSWESAPGQDRVSFEVHQGEWLVFQPVAIPLFRQIMEGADGKPT